MDEATATKELKGERVDLAVETLVKVAPIRGAHDTKSVVYRIEVAGGAAGEQFAEGTDDRGATALDAGVDVVAGGVHSASVAG